MVERKTTQDARQGETPGVVRWVLMVSLALAVIAMFVAYFVVWPTGPS